ncbi:MAG: hypothetical protein IBJ11_02665 [Phycisphaerales bacterium]|nr:hypothetical protein [Phycisphaerales bacterium]
MSKSRTVSALAGLALGVGAAAGASAQCTPVWATNFLPPTVSLAGTPGVSGSVFAVCVHDDGVNGPSIYVGGSFTTASGNTAAGVARWNGTQFVAVGPVTNQINTTVNSLVSFDEDGPGPLPARLFAGGSFTTGGTPAVTYNRIARWNGTIWEPLPGAAGNGLNSTVNQMAVWDEDGAGPNPPRLFIGGAFTASTGGAANSLNRIARWDGTSFTPVGTGTGALLNGVSSTVQVVKVMSGVPGSTSEGLWLGGAFSTVAASGGPLTATGIAKWDGTAYSRIGTGIGSTSVRTMEVFDEDGAGPNPARLFVGGSFTSGFGITTPTTTVNRIVAWDGTAWARPAAFGDAGFADWVRWMTLWDDDGAGPNPPALYIVGDFLSYGSPAVTVNRVLKYDGTTVSMLNSSNNDWTFFAYPNPTANELLVGGLFTTSGSPAITTNRIARWNGTSWSAFVPPPPPPPPVGYGLNGQILASVIWDDDGAGPNPPALFVAGTFTQANNAGTNVTMNRVAKWTGVPGGWQALGPGVGAGVVWDMIPFDPDGAGPLPEELVICGTGFSTIGSTTVNSVAKWNGTTWSALGTGLGFNSDVAYRLLVWDEDGAGPNPARLFMGGSFYGTVGGTNAVGGVLNTDGLARWNGTAWSSVAGSFPTSAFGFVSGLEAFDPDGAGPLPESLFVGGSFSATRTLTGITNLARFDPVANAWSSVPGAAFVTASEYIGQILRDGNRLVLNGIFTNGAATAGANNIVTLDDTGVWAPLGTGTSGNLGTATSPEVWQTIKHDFDGPGPQPAVLIAVGSFTSPGSGIAAWNGTSWSPVGSGADKVVNTVVSFVDGIGSPGVPALYVGGFFDNVSSGPAVASSRIGRFGCETVATPPGAFTLSTPTNNQLIAKLPVPASLRPDFSWTASAGAATYTIEVTTPADTSFTTPVVVQTGITGLSATLGTDLAYATKYLARVRAVNPNGSTTASPASVLIGIKCQADVDNNGAVGANDLSLVLTAFGTSCVCSADVDGNGSVGANDLSLLLTAFGNCSITLP